MRYQNIESKIWYDEKFIKLTPLQQRLFLYLLTCPHGNFLGIFTLKLAYVMGDLNYYHKISLQKDLMSLPFVKIDIKNNVIWIVNLLKYSQNYGHWNEKHKKGAIKLLKELPKSYLIQEFIKYYKELLGNDVSIGVSIGVSIDLPIPYAISETETETETETEKKYIYVSSINKKITKESAYGEFNNVFLTDEELIKLNQKLGEQQTFSQIEALSCYMQSKGIKYKSHYATILNWNRKEKKQIPYIKKNSQLSPFDRCPVCKKETTIQNINDLGSCPNCVISVAPETIKKFINSIDNKPIINNSPKSLIIEEQKNIAKNILNNITT